MILVEFRRHHDDYLSFCVSGHAGYATHGLDIVCAGVSSAVQLTVNGITEILGQSAEVKATQECISLQLSPSAIEFAQPFVKALVLQLSLMAEDYKNTIEIVQVEV